LQTVAEKTAKNFGATFLQHPVGLCVGAAFSRLNDCLVFVLSADTCDGVLAVLEVRVFYSTLTDSVADCHVWRRPPSCVVLPTQDGSWTTDRTAT